METGEPALTLPPWNHFYTYVHQFSESGTPIIVVAAVVINSGTLGPLSLMIEYIYIYIKSGLNCTQVRSRKIFWTFEPQNGIDFYTTRLCFVNGICLRNDMSLPKWVTDELMPRNLWSKLEQVPYLIFTNPKFSYFNF